MAFEIDTNFQTLPVVADYMATMASNVSLPVDHIKLPRVLEPTPGTGKLVWALQRRLIFNVYYPDGDFWKSDFASYLNRFEIVVMNPPFNPVDIMERFVNHAMAVSDNIIVLLPWTYLINSDRRVGELRAFGLVSITSLPRKAFPGCRVQTAIFELKKDYAGPTEFKRFTW